MNTLAVLYYSQAKYAQAEEFASETLQIRRRVLGLDHPDTLRSRNNLANTYQEQGKYASAEAL
jgi:hypothetical protein